MRKCTLVVLLSCAVLIPAAQAADSSLLGLAPADSSVLIGIDVRQILQSDFGKLIAEQVAGPGHPEAQGFAAMAGFDPLRDLDEVLIAAPAKQNPNGLMLLRGHFDVAKVSQLAAMVGMKGADYHGVQVMAKPGQAGGFSAMAVLDPTLVVAGDEAGVRAFVDRRGRAVNLNAAIAAKAGEMSKANGIWVLLNAAPATLVPQGANPGTAGKLLETIEQASFGVRFGPEIVLWAHAVTHTAEDAEGMVGVVRFFTGMAAANQTGNPQLAALLGKVKMDSEGNTAKLTLAIPEAEAEAAIRDAIAARMRAKEPEPEASPEPNEPSSPDPDAETPKE